MPEAEAEEAKRARDRGDGGRLEARRPPRGRRPPRAGAGPRCTEARGSNRDRAGRIRPTWSRAGPACAARSEPATLPKCSARRVELGLGPRAVRGRRRRRPAQLRYSESWNSRNRALLARAAGGLGCAPSLLVREVEREVAVKEPAPSRRSCERPARARAARAGRTGSGSPRTPTIVDRQALSGRARAWRGRRDLGARSGTGAEQALGDPRLESAARAGTPAGVVQLLRRPPRRPL